MSRVDGRRLESVQEMGEDSCCSCPAKERHGQLVSNTGLE